MICETCKHKKTRTQDGGKKIRCAKLHIDLGYSQSIDDPAFPMNELAKITDCDCFESVAHRIEDIQAAKVKVFTRDESNRLEMLDPPNPTTQKHPFGG